MHFEEEESQEQIRPAVGERKIEDWKWNDGDFTLGN